MATATLNPILDSITGSVGRMVFYTRHGKTVMRIWIKPPNPRTRAQQANRSRFAEAMASWRGLAVPEKNTYAARAKKLGIAGHNLFIREYMRTRGVVASDSAVEHVIPAPSSGKSERDNKIPGSTPDVLSRAPIGGQGDSYDAGHVVSPNDTGTAHRALSNASPSLHKAFRSVTAPSFVLSQAGVLYHHAP